MTIDQVLAWADVHRERTGKWPKRNSGRVYLAPFESWKALDDALNKGFRGLPRDSSLAKLLAQHRGARSERSLPPLTVEQILVWVDAHRKKTGRFPRLDDGRIYGERFVTWRTVDHALRTGRGGLPGGSSLPILLWEHRRVRRQGALPPLSVKQILRWADAFHQSSGKWPVEDSGAIDGTEGQTWKGVSQALRFGLRGLRRGSSLAKLLAKRRGVRNRLGGAPLAVEQILAWADAHRERTGLWPNPSSGPVEDAPGETWKGICMALLRGTRGMSGSKTLRKLLEENRNLPRGIRGHLLTVDEILAWADEHHRRTGQWPTRSAARLDGQRLSWNTIDDDLREGSQGLPGGSSLPKLLAEHRGWRNPAAPAPLTIEQILAWAELHRRQTGEWPNGNSGPVIGASGETWGVIQNALIRGYRGLPRGSSLATLLAEHSKAHSDTADLPRLTIEQILAWADAHHRHSGWWPNDRSGPVCDVFGESWGEINKALHEGTRGLPSGSSLAKILAKYRGVQRHRHSSPLTIRQILSWADQYHERTGQWPQVRSGIADETSGLTWSGINCALHRGGRGLPGGSALHKLLVEERGVPRKRGSLR